MLCTPAEGQIQYCQLSWIIRESPDFGPYLPVSRLESDISRIIAKVAISCRLDFPTIKFQIFCIVWATVNMEHFHINSGMPLYVYVYVLYESIRILWTNDVISRATWRNLSFLPYQFSIFDDVGGWQPCRYLPKGLGWMEDACPTNRVYTKLAN